MTDRSIVTAWVVLVASLVALVALFDWAFVHVVGRSAAPVIRTETNGPVSGVHGTATGADVRAAPVLEGSASLAVSSASAGEAVTESVAVPSAGGGGEPVVAETPDAATAWVGDLTVATAEDTIVEAVEGAPIGAIGDTSVGAIEDVPAEATGDTSGGADEDVPVGVIEGRSVEAAESVAERRAEGDVVADASSDDATAVGETVRDAVPDTAAAEEPTDAARKAAGTPFPEVAAALPDGVYSNRPSVVTDGTPIVSAASIDADADADTAADLEALRLLLAEATAIEAATEPFGEGTETSAERTMPDDDTSRRASTAVLNDLADAIRFEPRSATFGRDVTTALDELAALLADRPDLTVTVGVAADEFGDETLDRVLGRERGRAIIAGLVARGVAFERLSLSTDDAGASSPGSHRVRIVADTDG